MLHRIPPSYFPYAPWSITARRGLLFPLYDVGNIPYIQLSLPPTPLLHVYVPGPDKPTGCPQFSVAITTSGCCLKSPKLVLKAL